MELYSNTLLQGGKYRIDRVLGQGGFGITYIGEHVGLKRIVAIKEFFMKDYCSRQPFTGTVVTTGSDKETLVSGQKCKFLKEAQTIAELSNPYIVRIFDVFEENNTAYYVMEYLTGTSVYEDVAKNGAYSEDRAVRITRKIGKALSYIHQHKILHLDVKPANIMLRSDEDVVLIDFGISKHYNEQGGQTSVTPPGISHGYAPMEQYNEGGVAMFSPATDTYSLGATLLYMLSGQCPPDAFQIFENGLPVFPPNLSPATCRAIKAAMQPIKKDRPQQVEAFLQMLDNADSMANEETLLIEKTSTEASSSTNLDANESENLNQQRAFIEELISQGNYKDAYNICLQCMDNESDVEYVQAKIRQLIPLIKKKSRRGESWQDALAVIIATAITIAIILLLTEILH